jgi:hypothetical protein
MHLSVYVVFLNFSIKPSVFMHPYTHTHTHSLAHSLTHSLSLTHSPTPSLTHSIIHTLPPSLPHSQATISGFSSVYFEQILKREGQQPSIWERNFQLAAYSVLVLMATSIADNMRDSINNPGTGGSTGGSSGGGGVSSSLGFFHGWSAMTVIITVMNGATGLVIAATLKYADAVLKCLATSCAIIVTSVVGYFCFESVIDVFVSIGMVTVIVAVFNYTLDATPAPPPAPAAEGSTAGACKV